MFQKMRSILAVSTFEEEEKILLSKQLTNIAHIMLAGTTLFAVAASILAPALLPRMVFVIPWYIIIFVIYFLVYRKHLRTASLLIVTGMWILLTISAALNGGVETPAFAGNLIVILAAALLLDQRSAILFAGLGIVSGIGMMFAQEAHILPMPSQELNTLSYFWLAQAIYFVAAIFLVRMSTEKVAQALRYAKSELDERRKLEAE